MSHPKITAEAENQPTTKPGSRRTAPEAGKGSRTREDLRSQSFLNTRTVCRLATVPEHRGFTLIELLVVLTVISLLAAMLLPALNRAKGAARSTVCRSNLGQVGKASFLYSIDANRFPTFLEWLYARTPGANDDPTNDLTSGQLYPYLKSRQIYVCPSAKPRPTPPKASKKDPPLAGSEHSYTMNCFMCHAHDIAACIAPADTMFFLEQSLTYPGPRGGIADTGSPSAVRAWTEFNHKLRSHLLMVDGHVESLDVKKFDTKLAIPESRFPNSMRGRSGKP